MNKEYKEEAQKFIDDLPVEDLFDEIRKVTGLSDLKFTYKVEESCDGRFEIEFTSQDLADKVGFLKLLFKELYIKQLSSFVEYVDDDNEEDKYYYCTIKELEWLGMVSFSFTHLSGGSNYDAFLGFRYTKRKGWEIW